MSLSLVLSAMALQTEPVVIITGMREPVDADDAPVSATLFNNDALLALALPSAADVLRLSPGVSVATTGSRGTQTQVRIRGAEANHSLLFLDGIRFNDPASGNEPRLELLTTDTLSRIEIVRGPQSALWGAEALGGVIAVNGPDPLLETGFSGSAEYGSLDSARLFGRQALHAGNIGIIVAAGWQRGDGINSFGMGGERDGFEVASATLKAVHRAGPLELGLVGHWLDGLSEFDGLDPGTFRRADTLDETGSRIGAGRVWAAGEWGAWTVQAEASYLDSANRNRLGAAPLNATFGDRVHVGGQITRRIGGHWLIAAVDHQAEDFRARDTAFFGGTDQDRGRRMTAFVGEWRGEWSSWLVTDLAARHDDFSAFEDATTWRAAALLRPVAGWTVHAGYGEGIAQPTFFDLFGFFPNSFIGNSRLEPESSRGWEAGIRWAGPRISLAAAAFSSRLRDEIVDIFDPATFLSSTANASGVSRRDGVELSVAYRHGDLVNIDLNYTWLDADEQPVAGAGLLREVRRPRHSANLAAFGSLDRFGWSTSLAYVGSRRDIDFDLLPAEAVKLDGYWLASLRLGYRVLPQLELYTRIENALDDDHQDVVGYNSAGRTVHAGFRVVLDR